MRKFLIHIDEVLENGSLRQIVPPTDDETVYEAEGFALTAQARIIDLGGNKKLQQGVSVVQNMNGEDFVRLIKDERFFVKAACAIVADGMLGLLDQDTEDGNNEGKS